MTTLPGFVAKMDRLATTQGRVTRQGVEACALYAKTSIQASMVAHGVTPGKKLKTAGAVNVGYKIRGYTNAQAVIAMRGPAHLVNNPVGEHVIGAKGLATRAGHRKRAGGGRGAYGGARRKSNGQAMALTVKGGLYASVHHPGTKGKHFFEDALPGIRAEVPKVMARAEHAALAREFTGG